MVDAYRVPRRATSVKIVTDDGQTLDGDVFTAMIGPDGQPGRVVDRLNDPSEEFLAMKVGDDRFLLNKSGIVMVQMHGEFEEEPDLEPPGGRDVTVRLQLAAGFGLVGRLSILMPQERCRVIDYMNSVPRFFPLHGSGQVTLVQKGFVVSVRELEGEE